MNRATIIGNLTKDTELRTTGSGISVCTFTVAVARGFGDKKETDFLPVVTWRALAENCAKHLHKGSKVGVSGRIQTRSYDASNGEKRYATEIVADEVEFLTPKNDALSGSGTPNQFDRDREPADVEYEPLDDEQIPF